MGSIPVATDLTRVEQRREPRPEQVFAIDRRRSLFVSVILPCLNEVTGVAATVQEAIVGIDRAGLTGEVIVVDNGSIDGSPLAAARGGARVIFEPRRGYGLAIRRGLREASGQVIVVADADRSYDLRELGTLVQLVVEGADLVLGTRLDGRLDDGAMPWLNRRLGTPALNLLLATTTGRRFRDSQSGFRALRRECLLQLPLTADGMEFASELLVRANQAGLRIEEVPVRYRLRMGTSKLRPFGDGLRHCHLLLRIGRPQFVTRRTR